MLLLYANSSLDESECFQTLYTLVFHYQQKYQKTLTFLGVQLFIPLLVFFIFIRATYEHHIGI